MAETCEAKISTFTLIFQLINIMVYDSYVEKGHFSTKKMLAEPVEAKFSTINYQFSIINIMVYDSYGEKQQKNRVMNKKRRVFKIRRGLNILVYDS